jgi:thiol:disulfide interchange protein DsbD
MTAASAIRWQPYSTAALSAALARGDKTIMVKFTAAWCANCHVNERIINASDEAVSLLNSASVIVYKADLTSEEDEGWEKLRELGSGGIPFIAVWHPGDPEPVKIRGQLASASPVTDALKGGGLNLAASDRMIFDFLGKQFTVAKDASLLILLLALIAGFFMNFTPCVLPVVPLKILSIQAHAKNPTRCLVLGLIFGLGIIVAFAALGLLIAVFKTFDWGGMFGKWWFAAGVGVIVGAMGLGMLGLFSIRLPQFVYMLNPQSETAGGSFAMGAFTAVLSTPCTGPLIGATIAWLLLQPKWLGFTTFVVMGLGMALPYILLTARPAWLARLPRTGPGSELVKQVMGLLLLAVASFFIGVAATSLAA